MKIKLITFVLFSLIILPVISFAAQDGTTPTSQEGTTPTAPINYGFTIPNPLKNGVNNLPDLLNLIITSIIIPIGGVVAAIMIMHAGFMFVTASGDPKKIQDAKSTLLYACIGAAVLLGADLIAHIINNTVTQLK